MKRNRTFRSEIFYTKKIIHMLNRYCKGLSSFAHEDNDMKQIMDEGRISFSQIENYHLMGNDVSLEGLKFT